MAVTNTFQTVGGYIRHNPQQTTTYTIGRNSKQQTRAKRFNYKICHSTGLMKIGLKEVENDHW